MVIIILRDEIELRYQQIMKYLILVLISIGNRPKVNNKKELTIIPLNH